MDKIILTPLKIISNPKGDIFKVIKKNDAGFVSFGEVYFSTVNKNEIKGWKKHRKMTLNIVVPIGEIKFVIFDENNKNFFQISISKKNYQRLTVPPNYWVAFKGIHEYNLLLNLSNIIHDPYESINLDLNDIYYNWN